MRGEVIELKELKSQEGSAQNGGTHYPDPEVPHIPSAYGVVGHHHHEAAHQQDEGAGGCGWNIQDFAWGRCTRKALAVVHQIRGYERAEEHTLRPQESPYEQLPVV